LAVVEQKLFRKINTTFYVSLHNGEFHNEDRVGLRVSKNFEGG